MRQSCGTHCLDVETREQKVSVTGDPANACNSKRGVGVGAEESRKGVHGESVRNEGVGAGGGGVHDRVAGGSEGGGSMDKSMSTAATGEKEGWPAGRVTNMTNQHKKD